MGRDAYAEEALRFPAKEENEGPFIFQVKFVEAANAAGAEPMPRMKAATQEELRRIAHREEAGEWNSPRHYALVTNAPLDGTDRGELKEILEAGLPKSQITILDSADIDAMLDDSPRVRLAYPQVLGLRDLEALLSRAVSGDILTRSSLTIEIAKDLSPTFVATEAYAKALSVLSARNFVVLTGPPEMGKTSIGRMISLARLSGEWEAYECKSPDDLFKVLDNESSQVFFVDDAFGATEYEPDRATLWADELDKVIRALDYRHWLILTSRPAPLRTALERLHLQGEAEDFPEPQSVLVNAAELSVQEKAQMLYRHAKEGVTDNGGRALIREHAREIVDHEHFTPLRIHRFITKQMPEILEAEPERREELMAEAVVNNMESATRSMTISFNRLPGDCKTLLIAMLDMSGTSVRFEQLARAFERHLEGEPERPVEETAEMIDAHFISLGMQPDPYEPEKEIRYASWVHPSVRDLVIEHLRADAAARRRFLGHARIDGVMLALSSEGGARGDRRFPLLEGPEDWTEISSRVVELVKAGEPNQNARLMALLSNTSRLAGAEEAAAQAGHLLDLTQAGLVALGEHPAAAEALSVATLRSFYNASSNLLPPVAGPDVRPIWEELVARVRASLEGPVEEFVGECEQWLDLTGLLRSFEPRWAIGLAFPEAYENDLQAIVARLEAAEEMLGRPEVEDEDELDEYADPPPDVDWVITALEILSEIRAVAPELDEHCEGVAQGLEERSSEWESYAEGHRAYSEPERDEGEDDTCADATARSARFSTSASSSRICNSGGSGRPRASGRGAYRNRTGVNGFAGRCVATPPRRRSEAKRSGGPRYGAAVSDVAERGSVRASSVATATRTALAAVTAMTRLKGAVVRARTSNTAQARIRDRGR
jgi:hypothetical protein